MSATTIDNYLARVPDDKRAALDQLREQIHAAAPDATEAIRYGVPAFMVDDRWLVGFSATKKYCSFYAGAGPIQVHAEELASYRLGKGTINYAPDQPLPSELVTKLVDEARQSRAR